MVWAAHSSREVSRPFHHSDQIWNPITFSRSAFELAVDAAAQDLRDFLKPLRAWLDVRAPQASAKFVSKFAASFVRA